ncbi:hypothetical protein C8R44DRAFT_750325 [Mycena epipterygia]|nr:hypothetical protein C8R44DRAFT_750325 [Mycena epipterygia]
MRRQYDQHKFRSRCGGSKLVYINQYESLSRQCRHPWPGVWEASGDEPEKEKMSNGSEEQHLKKNQREQLRTTNDTPEKGGRDGPRRQRDPEPLYGRERVPSEREHQKRRRRELKSQKIRTLRKQPWAKQRRRGGERKKDLESCHVDRSTADAAVELLTRKKLTGIVKIVPLGLKWVPGMDSQPR